MEFRIVLDKKNLDSSLGTSPPTDIDTDSEAKKKESGNIFDFLSQVWQLGGTPINHIHGGQSPPVPYWLNFLTYYTKGGRLMMCKVVTSLTHMVCPTPMGHKAELSISNY